MRRSTRRPMAKSISPPAKECGAADGEDAGAAGAGGSNGRRNNHYSSFSDSGFRTSRSGLFILPSAADNRITGCRRKAWEGAGMKPVLVALLVSLHTVTGAFAQTAPEGDHDFTAIAGRPAVVVIDDLGKKTQGQLLRFTPDRLTMMVEGSEISIERRNVASVVERGDSVMNGMLFGALGGTGLGVLGLLTSENQGDFEQAAVPFFTILGLGVGTAVDALITGKRVIYDRATGDFATMAEGLAVIVVDDQGRETRGRTLQLTPDELTLMVDGKTRTLGRSRVARVFAPGDSLKNGMMIGLLTGAAIGAVSGATQSTCGGFMEPLRTCSAGDRAGFALVGGALFGGLGTALGAGIDAMIPGRRLLYQKPLKSNGVVMSLTPAFAASGTGLSMRVSW